MALGRDAPDDARKPYRCAPSSLVAAVWERVASLPLEDCPSSIRPHSHDYANAVTEAAVFAGGYP